MTSHHSPKSISDTLAAAAKAADCCAAHAAAIDRDGAFPTDEFRWLSEAGLLGVSLAPELGGLGLGVLPGTTPALLNLLRRIGQGNLAVGRLYEGHVNALLLMQSFGSSDQKRRWADDAHRGRLFSVWNTQAEDGVRLVPLPAERYRLEGAKTFASGAEAIARPLLTGALPDGGWQMVILPVAPGKTAAGDPAFWQPLGMRATASIRMDFTGLEVTRDDLLGAPGDYYRQPAFSGGAIRFMAVQVGGAQALLEATRIYLADQGRTEDPFQRARVGRMAALIETGCLWLQNAGRLGETADAETVVEYTHLARATIEDVCLEVMRLAERCVGARGLLRPHPIERIHRDLTLYLRQAGADTALVSAGRFVLESTRPADVLWNVAP